MSALRPHPPVTPPATLTAVITRGMCIIFNLMSDVYISLARKWRPRRLADMVGQEYVVRALQNAAQQERLHHALLFSGTRGIGKTTLARIVAMLINCSGRDSGSAEPCLECDFCRDIMTGRLTDVIEQDAASHTQVDKMRDLLESAVYAPARAKYKVFIIDEVHMLTKQSFNAMLKTLEEPPPHVKFILATTDPQKLPATVRSRCLCFSLLPLTQTQISERLQYILTEEKIAYQPAATAVVARLASGSMRDALSILDQAVAHCGDELQAEDVRRIAGDIGTDMLADILRAVASGDGSAIDEITNRHLAHHVSFDASLARLSTLLYKIALLQSVPNAATSDDIEEAAIIKEMAAVLSAEQLQVLYEIALRSRQQLPLAPDEATGFAMALLRMTLFTPTAALAPPVSPVSRNGSNAAAKSSPASAIPSAAATSVVREENKTPWQQTVAQLDEMAQALAMHCIVEHYDDKGVQLVLDTSSSKFADKFLPELKTGLQTKHGEDFVVQLRIGTDDAASVARHNALLEKANATEFSRNVQEAFPNATLQADSVQVVEQSTTQEQE